MLSMENIPDEVVEQMLSYLLSEEWKSDNRFKHNLFYLTICPRWRRLAKPMVFKEAFINYDEEMDKNVDGTIENLLDGNEAAPETEAEVKYVNLASNLDLIHAAGCSTKIKHINIEIKCLGTFYSGLTNVTKLLENASKPYKIKHMFIDMHTGMQTDDNNVSDNNSTAKLANITRKMAQNIPEIKHLTFSGSVYDKDIHLFYGQIAEYYAGQLETLICHSSVKFLNHCEFMHLEHVKLKIDDISDITAVKLSADKLKSLEIRSMISIHGIHLFGMFDCSTDILFSNLQELCLSCFFENPKNAAQTNIERSSLRLIFPKLRKLHVDDSSSNYSHHMLNHMVLPAYIDSINIGAANSIYEEIRNKPLPAANKVRLSANFLETNPSIVFNMNYILNRVAQCQSASMTINCSTYSVNADDITFTKLTSLHIFASTHISPLVLLLEKLPNLTDLLVYGVVLNDISESIVIPEISCHKHQPIVSINSNLEDISLMCSSAEYSNKTMISVVLYLLLKLPKLQTCSALHVSKELFLARLELYMPFYPHVSNVKFCLDSGWFNI